MKIFMGVGGLGVVENDGRNKYLHGPRMQGKRIYATDVSDSGKYLLYADSTTLYLKNLQYCSGRDHTARYTTEHQSIHSAYFLPDRDCEVIYADALTDSVCFYNFSNGDFRIFSLRDIFKDSGVRYVKYNNGKDLGAEDFMHVNYARVIGKKIYVTAYRHPDAFNPEFDGIYDGAGFVFELINGSLVLIDVVQDVSISKPHSMIPFRAGVLVASSGNEQIVYYNLREKKVETIYYPFASADLSTMNVDPDRKIVKYTNGVHYLQHLRGDLVFMLCPNLRTGVIYDCKDNAVEYEISVPLIETSGEEMYRPYQAKVINH